MQSHESRAQGGGRPPAGSLAAQAQSAAAANETGTKANAGTTATQGSDPATQSRLDREANFVEAADRVQSKLETAPGSVSKAEADKLHSREVKAFGGAEKGGIAAKAQSQAAKNEQ